MPNKMVVGAIKQGISILANPREEFSKLNKRTLESVVGDYAMLLVTAAMLAGLSKLIYSILRALYLDLSLDVSIQYGRMINYSIGRSASMFFFYLFAGTFLLFFLSFMLKPFLHRIKYISLVKILLYSLTPLLLFSWFLSNPGALAIWSILLLVIGIRAYKEEKIKKNSIKNRE